MPSDAKPAQVKVGQVPAADPTAALAPLYVASISGGKDSAAMALHLKEQGIPFRAVHLFTGWDHDGLIDYIRGPLTDAIGPVEELRPQALPLPARSLRPRVAAAVAAGSPMIEWVLKKGMFPSKARRFCTEEIKVRPMARYIAGLQDAGAEVINAVGIRSDESEARSKLAEREWSDAVDCEVWRPILRWSLDDVIAIHQRHNLKPCDLYLKGLSRVGCWPCIYARKSEIRAVAEMDPERIELLRELEADVADAALARWEKREEKGENDGKPFHSPSWFQAPLGDTGEPWPIDRVVEWSKTIRGGREEDKQELLFAGHNDGCMRWGLCETK